MLCARAVRATSAPRGRRPRPARRFRVRATAPPPRAMGSDGDCASEPPTTRRVALGVALASSAAALAAPLLSPGPARAAAASDWSSPASAWSRTSPPLPANPARGCVREDQRRRPATRQGGRRRRLPMDPRDAARTDISSTEPSTAASAAGTATPASTGSDRTGSSSRASTNCSPGGGRGEAPSAHPASRGIRLQGTRAAAPGVWTKTTGGGARVGTAGVRGEARQDETETVNAGEAEGPPGPGPATRRLASPSVSTRRGEIAAKRGEAHRRGARVATVRIAYTHTQSRYDRAGDASRSAGPSFTPSSARARERMDSGTDSVPRRGRSSSLDDGWAVTDSGLRADRHP